jgi:hypothetical protein
MPDQTAHSKPVRLAATAFHAGLAGKWNIAQRAVQRIADECGGEGIGDALLAWCDTLTAHARGGTNVLPTPIRVQFWNGDTGQLDGPDSERVPAATRWAGRLIAARAAMDLDTFRATLNTLPEDQADSSRYVWAVLQVTVWQVRGLPRGYTRMGGGRDA